MQKKQIWTLLGVITAYFGYQYFQKAVNFIESVTFKVHKMNIDLAATIASGFKYIVLPTIFNVNNTTDIKASIQKVELNFFYNEKLIGTVGSVTDITLPGNASTLVNTTVKLTTGQLIKVVPSIKEFVNGQRTFVIKGIVKTSLGNVNVNETVTL